MSDLHCSGSLLQRTAGMDWWTLHCIVQPHMPCMMWHLRNYLCPSPSRLDTLHMPLSIPHYTIPVCRECIMRHQQRQAYLLLIPRDSERMEYWSEDYICQPHMIYMSVA